MILLSPVEMGDNLNLEAEYTYPCSDGGKLTTIDIRPALKAQAKKDAQENIDAITDYSDGRISVERLAKRLNVNVYGLYAALNKYAKEIGG